MFLRKNSKWILNPAVQHCLAATVPTNREGGSEFGTELGGGFATESGGGEVCSGQERKGGKVFGTELEGRHGGSSRDREGAMYRDPHSLWSLAAATRSHVPC